MKKIKATLRTRNLKPVDQAYFMYEHLEGEAKDEIRVTDQEQRWNIQIRFSLFLKSCMVALNPICNKAFSRGRIFTCSVLSYEKKVERCVPGGACFGIFRDQFIEHVYDSNLQTVGASVTRLYFGCALGAGRAAQ